VFSPLGERVKYDVPRLNLKPHTGKMSHNLGILGDEVTSDADTAPVRLDEYPMKDAGLGYGVAQDGFGFLAKARNEYFGVWASQNALNDVVVVAEVNVLVDVFEPVVGVAQAFEPGCQPSGSRWTPEA